MAEKYEHLCTLVNKEGVSYQSKGLCDGFPEGRRGGWRSEMGTGLNFELRMQVVRNADIDTGKTQLMHEIFWKRTLEQEEEDLGDESVATDCGH